LTPSPGPSSSISVVVPTVGGPRLERVLASLAVQTAAHELIVVDDSGTGAVEDSELLAGAELVRMERNSGFSRAVNLGAERAGGDALVLLNDDCVVDADFLESLTRPLDPAAGVAMVAAVMRDWAHAELIDSAGMELDPTLLVWDYLNGEPLMLLDRGVPDPVGPSAAAAAFDRAAFRAEGGFDEALFAYWEDVDLVLRLRRHGYECRLAADARGTHEHSGSFRSGSARKNYLTGFGRGYVLRKWGVIGPRRIGPVLARDLVTSAGQAVIDRNLSGVRGRIEGWRAAQPSESYPRELPVDRAPGALGTLRRRRDRRARLRARASRPAGGGPLRSIAFFHLAETSGPSRSLERELEWLAGRGELEVVVPGPGAVAELFGEFASITELDYDALNRPPGAGGTLATLRTLAADVSRFRSLIRTHEADLVVVVTAMLPAALIAAQRERVPAVVYCGELFAQRGMSGAQLLARQGLRRLTGRLAAGIATGSDMVAAQFAGSARGVVRTVYPPVGEQYAAGDGTGWLREHAIDPEAPLVVAAGSITEGRGQDVLVRAIAIARERLPDLRCVIAGAPFDRPQDVEFAQRLRGLVAELELIDAVTLPGHVDDVSALLAAADVVVNPSRFDEPFGRVPFEAALAGTPAVVTRVGAADELFRDGESALVVAPEDPEAIAAAIQRLIDNPALAARLVAAASAFARARLTPEASVAGFRGVVEAVVA